MIVCNSGSFAAQHDLPAIQAHTLKDGDFMSPYHYNESPCARRVAMAIKCKSFFVDIEG